ncbi:MAG: PHP-associated domain-containing protein [Promethearchaeia archaeon]
MRKLKKVYPIEKYGALFDAHIHSYFDYHDGMLSPKQIVDCTIKCGFNWVLAMSHDTCIGNKIITRKAKEKKLPCITGIEVSTIHNHLLAYGVYEWKYRRDTLTPEEAIELLREQDAAIFLAHPCSNPRRIKNGYWYPEIAKKLDFDGIEWINGSQSILNRKTWNFFRSIPESRRIAGTDSHHPSTFGFSFTQVNINSTDPDDLVAAMKKGKCRALGTYVPLHRIIYSGLAAIIENNLIKRKFIENKWIKTCGDHPESILPPVVQDHNIWLQKILKKPDIKNDFKLN